MPASEDYLRNIKTMHKVFCLSAVALLACTVWMMWADYDDEWRTYQRTALKHIAERDRSLIAQIEADPEFKAKLADLQAEKKAAEGVVESQAALKTELETAARDAAVKSSFHMRTLRVERAKRDVARATYGLGISGELPADQIETLFKAYQDQEAKVAALEAEYMQLEFTSSTAKAKLNELLAGEANVAKKLKELESEIDRRQAAINKIEPTDPLAAMKRQIMLLPIINGFNSPERIQQDWMPQLKIDLGGMSKVDRFDRCRTCHVSIDAVAGGTEPAFPPRKNPHDEAGYDQPYSSHPRLDLFLTSTSPHPLPKFGCTVCHGGQGSGTSFTNASHTPNDPHEAEEWSKDHKWFDNHFWEHPMHAQRFEESGCIKCHINVVELGHHPKFGATAPKVAKGYDLVKTYGCFGCHEINGYDGKKPIGPDLRLEPNSPEEMAKAAADPLTTAGRMRKVGPSLKHIGSKAPEGWVAYWTDEPKRFRPTTRMPQFFHLTNQQDELAERFNPVEVAAVAHYLEQKSQPLELLKPKDDYQPVVTRGLEFFATKGCASCHRHEGVPAVPGEQSTFGPELSKINAKLLPGAEGFEWLYTWIRDPQRHHPRTKMPNLYLEPEGKDEKYVDPAADIAAFLLKLEGKPADFKPSTNYLTDVVDPQTVDQLTQEFLKKLLTETQIATFLKDGKFPLPAGGIEAIKGDEIELVTADGTPISDPAELLRRKLNYVGRRTISRYGCYGCHEIPNFEGGRPIGTALQDWGKKDRSRLAFEFIHEYTHHSGQAALGVNFETVTPAIATRLKLEPATGARVTEQQLGVHAIPGTVQQLETKTPFELQVDDVIVVYDGQVVTDAAQLQGLLSRTEPGSTVDVQVVRGGEDLTVKLQPNGSLHDRVETGIGMAERGEFTDDAAGAAEEARELSAAFFYESLTHHGRPGFLWQKLRQPRSYDFKMTDVKPYDDRLKMPKFPFNEDEIEAIATFVLGLVAEPPSNEYLFNPSGPKGDWIRGEFLLDQFNCASCHMLDMPEIRYGHDKENEAEITSVDLETEIPNAIDLLKRLKPPVKADTGRTITFSTDEGPKTLPVIQFHGMVTAGPSPDDAPEDQEYIIESWNTAEIDQKLFPPTTKFNFLANRLEGITPARGGQFAEWLVSRLTESKVAKDKNAAWQMSPPPLYLEGIKVQTPWLFNFLQNPEKIRHTTVLRMPKFNMSPDEAQALANYFAAKDDAAYPYQNVPQRDPGYLKLAEHQFSSEFPDKDHDYLSESWKLLNGPVCIKCHFVGGRQVVSKNPAEDIRGPNLDAASARLRSDWLLLWLYRPTWITPYTSMPQNFPKSKTQFEDIFGGNANLQTIGMRDALVNYHRLMERDGRVVYDPPVAPMPDAAAPAEDAAAVNKDNSEAEGAGQ